MLSKIGILFRTVRYIKPIQVLYQIRTRMLPSKFERDINAVNNLSPEPLTILPFPVTKAGISDGINFTFLNKTTLFYNGIDWGFENFGKLWNYNLQYLDFINQADLPEDIRIKWILDLYNTIQSGKIKIEPYPVSLRSINVIRFLSANNSITDDNKQIVHGLYLELQYLHSNYEYHLLGNHLLENGFCMLMGGHFFNVAKWKDKASKILRRELDEQILEDGAHFELSPMYHQIILWRVLEALSYLHKEDPLRAFIRTKAELMMGWLEKMTFGNGDLPHFNDSADGVAYTTAQLMKSALQLGLSTVQFKLKESGYRKFKNDAFELISDVHGISPVYQPGHSHSDHLSFVLYVKGNPFIVDPGTSTYAISQKRQWERSSQAHNTVTVANHDQSEVWGGFRVGRRAKAEIFSETDSEISAGLEYTIPMFTVRHRRNFSISDNFVAIQDSINYHGTSVARFYLHPDVDLVEISGEVLIFKDDIKIVFENTTEIKVIDYDFAKGFNNLSKAKGIEVSFKNNCQSVITIS